MTKDYWLILFFAYCEMSNIFTQPTHILPVIT